MDEIKQLWQDIKKIQHTWWGHRSRRERREWLLSFTTGMVTTTSLLILLGIIRLAVTSETLAAVSIHASIDPQDEELIVDMESFELPPTTPDQPDDVVEFDVALPPDHPPTLDVPIETTMLDAQMTAPLAGLSDREIGAEAMRRVRAQGGSIQGDIVISLIWDEGNRNDLDLHVTHTQRRRRGSLRREKIWYRNMKGRNGGRLDVDANASRPMPKPVENVFWPENQAPAGEYTVRVHHYAHHGSREPTTFSVRVSYGQETKIFHGMLRPRKALDVFKFEWPTGQN